MKEISGFIERIKPTRAQTHGILALVPLLAPETGEPDYLTLGQALERGVVSVTEVSDAGLVSELLVQNVSKRKVLILDGEELVGAKQNRVVNVTILVPPESKVKIPVSCVEQGRWDYRSREFSASKAMMPAYMRRMHQANVSYSRRHKDTFDSDQQEVWQGISCMMSGMEVKSKTGAIDDLFDRYEDPIQKYLDAFNLVDCQVGAVFELGGQILGLECFGHQATMGQYLSRIIKSYALDAIDPNIALKEGRIRGRDKKVRNLLEALNNCQTEVYPSVGLGQSVRFSGNGVTGSALLEEGNLIHLCAFSVTTGHQIRMNPQRK